MSPTELTIRKLKRDGWPLVRKVENWNHFARIRQDLFGFDVLAINQNRQLWVQATTAGNVSARVKKLRELPSTALVLSSPNVDGVVWGWIKNKSGRYELKRDVDMRFEV